MEIVAKGNNVFTMTVEKEILIQLVKAANSQIALLEVVKSNHTAEYEKAVLLTDTFNSALNRVESYQ